MASGGVYRRGNNWWYRFQINKKVYAGNAHVPTQAAARIVRAKKMAEVYRELGIRARVKPGPLEAIDAVYVWREQTERIEQEYSTVERFATWLGNGFLLNDVSVSDAAEWIQERLEEVTATTVLRNIASCSAFFTWAVRHEHCADNPWRKVAKPDGAWTSPTPLTENQVQYVLEQVVDHKTLGPAYHLAYYAGMRRGEFCRMRRDYIQGQDILIPGSKNEKSKARIPILPPMREYLEKHWSGPDLPMYMVTEFRDRPLAPNRASKILLNVNRKRREDTLQPLPNFHRMRHSICWHLIQKGYSLHEVASFLRNSVKMVERVYGHFNALTFRDRFDSF